MKTVRDACELQANALSIKLSDQIEQLDDLIHSEGDGNAFFEKTHITQGMQDLLSEGIARLAGASTQAVFHLKQAMGGAVAEPFMAKPSSPQKLPPLMAGTTPTISSGAK
jgi:hypothetical protein